MTGADRAHSLTHWTGEMNWRAWGESSKRQSTKKRNPRTSRSRLRFFRADAERLHLAIQMAALQAENFCRAAYIAMAVFQFAQDVVALIRLSRLLQRRKFLSVPACTARYQYRHVFPFDARDLRIQNQHSLQH